MDKPTSPSLFAPEFLDHLRSWEGRSEMHEDILTQAPARALAATLDHAGTGPVQGDELPPLWHWLYFLPRAPQRELGEDGHPRLGGFLPPVPLPRRMWAGGRLRWHEPLRLGEAARRVSTIESVMHKGGRTGDLLFVTVKHEISQGQGVALTEEHDIVYRQAAAPAAPGAAAPALPDAPAGAQWSRDIVPDAVLLFRYSALTFNGHRIHYDRSYVTQVEGYPGLIVHGPLIATLLMDLAREQLPAARFTSFSFKAVSPLFDLNPFLVCGKPSADGKSAHLWAQNHEGKLAMQAEVHYDTTSS